MHNRKLAITLLAAIAAGGCGGDEPAAEPPRPSASKPANLDGVYRYEVPADYLIERGIPPSQARDEGGVHTVTLDGGRFSDRWRNAQGSGTCEGTYEIAGNVVTFTWRVKCVGDWKMTFAREGKRLRWSNVRSLPPHNDAESQRVNEAFNSVPWLKIR